jgi:uncharacterized protein (TIGR03437 family)
MTNHHRQGLPFPSFSLAPAFITGLTGLLLSISIAATARAQTSTFSAADGILVSAAGSPYQAGPRDSGLAAGDLNGDGLPDLVIGGSGTGSNNLTILLNAGGGMFVPATPIPVSWSTTSVVLGDFNGDGNLDIAADGGSLSPNALQIFLGNGHGGFSPMPPISNNALGVYGLGQIGVGDFNHDGKLDLVVAGNNWVGSTLTGYLAVLLGDGTGTFSMPLGSPAETSFLGGDLTVGDFNKDGNLDLAIIAGNQVYILLGGGNGTFHASSQGPIPVGQNPDAIVQGDFNGDGNIDLAVANWFSGSLTILLGDGEGDFSIQLADLPVGSGGTTPTSLGVADMDGDGIQDIVVGIDNPSGEIAVYLGFAGIFQLPPNGTFNAPGGPQGLVLADFNSDGRPDVATANFDGTVSVFLGAPASSSVQLAVLGTSSGAAANPTVGVPISFAASAPSNGWDQPIGTVHLLNGSTIVGSGILDSGIASIQLTPSTAGALTLEAQYIGDLRTTGSMSAPLSVSVAKGTQTITFPPIPTYTYGAPPFSVAATASSGLPVTITVLSGPATISGNVLTLTDEGVVTLQASQSGNANYLAATSVQQQFTVSAPALQVSAVLNAASYAAGPVAPNSFAVLFGSNLATTTTVSSLSTTLGGTSIQMSDASGNSGSALLCFASPAQIDLIVPSNLNPGNGSMTLKTETGSSVTTPISIAAVSPGLFSADASGTGVAAGNAVRVSADGTQTQLALSTCSGTPVACTAVPIDLGASSDTVYLSLYGTGIRGRSSLSAAVSATIGGVAAPVQYAGPQPNFPGLDQVNLQISPSLQGRGSVPVALVVDGISANVVTVTIQ